MRSTGLIGIAALVISAPVAAQSNKFRTDDAGAATSTIQQQASTIQGQRRRSTDRIPPGQLPPAGMCRIWINDVPAGQQPAPTDCSSAVRNRPANGRVFFGDDPPKTKKGKSDKGKSKSSPTDELVDLITRRISR